MIYPVRSIRRRQQREKALVRLLTKYKILYLARINQKRYPKQPRSDNKNRVTFSGKTTVCRYDANDSPAEAIIRRPSHIKNISIRALREEAKRLNIDITHKAEEAIRNLVMKEWIAAMRQELSSFSISTKSIKDKDMEACYNVFIGLKIAANLLMAGVSIVPRTMSLTELHSFLKDHRLTCSSPQSILACIACAENYLMDSLPRTPGIDRSFVAFDSNMTDISRKRFSAINLFSIKYPFSTLSILTQELRSRGIHPAKTVGECRSILIGIEADELRNAFMECLKESVVGMLQTMKMSCTYELSKDFLSLVRSLPKDEVPEVFE